MNPPQKPTARNIFHPGVRSALLSEKPYISPISRHPEILTKKVPKGKDDEILFCRKRDARNLQMLPRNPPVPINNNVLIISVRNALTLPSRIPIAFGRQSNTKILITIVSLINN